MSRPRRQALAWLAAAGVVFVADLWLHLPITDFCDMLATRFGFEEYDRVTRNGFLVMGLLAAAAAWAWPSGRRVAVGTSTMILMSLAGASQVLIVVAGIENVHYPQYALLAYLIARGLGNAEGGWLWATGLGVVDEAYQWLVLPRGTVSYLDWNDIALNGIGAAFGVVMIVALSPDAGRRIVPGRVALVLGLACLVGAAILAPPAFSPFFSETPGGRRFHLMAASEGVSVLALLWWGVRRLLSRATLT
jgi:hypothetical protein